MEFIRQILTGTDNNFTYIFFDGNEIALIDPYSDKEKIEQQIISLEGNLKYIINTHTHFDHIGLNYYFQEKYKVPVIVHKNEETNIKGSKIVVENNEIFKIGNKEFKIIHTPGHSPGSICIMFENYLFSGDTLFSDEDCGRIFYTDGIYDMFESLKYLKTLDDNLIVLSGHKYGRYDYTTLGFEKKNNKALLCSTIEELKAFKGII